MKRWGVGCRAFGLTVVGLLVFTVIAGQVSVGDAAFSGRNGRIAFVWNPNTRVAPQSCLDIFSVKPSGLGRQRLTRGCPWEYSDPAYSGSGRLIAFVRGHEPFPRGLHGAGIYVMNSDGSQPRRITDSMSDQNPEFSRDGRRIVFSRFVKSGGRTQVFIVDSDGSHLRQLTHGGQGASEPMFSPGGSEIAFVAFHKHQGFNIFTVRLNSSHQRQLTHAAAGDWDDQPDFSPNGRRIVFRCGGGDFAAAQHICIMQANGTHIRRLTPDGRLGFVAQEPAYSPDGRQIAFLAQVGNDQTGLFTMRVDGSHRRTVYNLGPHQEVGGVSWQPLP